MSKAVPVLALAVGLIGGGASGALITHYLQKDDYAVSADSCSERGPEKAFLENIDTGYRVEIPNAIMPVALERVTTITNTGRKSINDEDIHIAVDREPNSTVLHTMVFYESPLSKHELVADSGGEVFKIKLKNFNPSDTITLVVASQRQVRVSVNSKAAGFTLHSIFSPGEFCGWLRRSYGGVVAYSKIAEGCTVGEGLSLSCEGRHTIRIPADFPPGRARIIYR